MSNFWMLNLVVRSVNHRALKGELVSEQPVFSLPSRVVTPYGLVGEYWRLGWTCCSNLWCWRWGQHIFLEGGHQVLRDLVWMLVSTLRPQIGTQFSNTDLKASFGLRVVWSHRISLLFKFVSFKFPCVLPRTRPSLAEMLRGLMKEATDYNVIV